VSTEWLFFVRLFENWGNVLMAKSLAHSLSAFLPALQGTALGGTALGEAPLGGVALGGVALGGTVLGGGRGKKKSRRSGTIQAIKLGLSKN
jgi:hypothetical protein